jgi:hypothetical protein
VISLVTQTSCSEPNRDIHATAPSKRRRRKEEGANNEEVRIRDWTCRWTDRRGPWPGRAGGRRSDRPGNAQETIKQLHADGYNVIVNRIGTTPLDQATVVAVRPGQTYSRTDSGTPGDSFGTTVTGKTVYVDVK